MGKKKTEEPKAPPKHEAIAAWQAILDAIPKGKMAPVFADANCLEVWLRRGLRGLQLLDRVRAYILDPVTELGGEESPFVKAIDELIPRNPPKET